ncbi:MAG: hypothetical protein B6I25_00550 [Planctomycetales bacterium 4572_13]|nr:MAG: hypothetical protein B6I25_00550 [Planctomycetales bacterium 4572_13]
MAKLNIEMCPETGICSIMKENGSKVDLLSGEVDQLRQAAGNGEKTKAVLAQIDAGFSDGLQSDELAQLAEKIK